MTQKIGKARVREMKDEIIQMYESGLSTIVIAERINAWPDTVYVVLKENNVNIRPMSEALRLAPCKGDSQGRYQRIAREIKPQVCEDCGSVTDLCVHHIDKNHANNTAENLKMLCKSCHAKLHFTAGDIGTRKWVTPEYKKEYMKKWRAENKEHLTAYERAYRLQNAERYREMDRRRYAAKKNAITGDGER